MPNGVLGEERRTIRSDRSRPRSSRLWWATTNLRDGGVLLPGFVQAPSRPCTWRNAPLGRCRTNVRRSFTRSQRFLCENNENDEYGGGKKRMDVVCSATPFTHFQNSYAIVCIVGRGAADVSPTECYSYEYHQRLPCNCACPLA